MSSDLHKTSGVRKKQGEAAASEGVAAIDSSGEAPPGQEGQPVDDGGAVNPLDDLDIDLADLDVASPTDGKEPAFSST